MGDDATSYCPTCLDRFEALCNKDTGALALPYDVCFDPRTGSKVARKTIWRKGDCIELMYWTETPPRHVIVHNTNRQHQSRVRLCEPALGAVVEKLCWFHKS